MISQKMKKEFFELALRQVLISNTEMSKKAAKNMAEEIVSRCQ